MATPGQDRIEREVAAILAAGMRRREFIAFLAGAAALWSRAAHAQRTRKVWRLGLLQPGAPPEPLLEIIKDGLRELGYVEGRDIVFEVRWAEGRRDRLAELANELVGSKVDAIHAFSTPAALAARDATATMPIVFSGVGDPVGTGLVPSLAHPGGNVTGISVLATELSAKRLEILREIVPDMSPVAMLWNDTNPSMTLRAKETQDAAVKLDVRIQSVGVHDVVDLEPAFTTISEGRAAALFTMADPFTLTHRKRIVEYAAQRRVPAIYEIREFVVSGGLVSYGPSVTAMQRRVVVYLDKIFKGTKPSDLPVEQPTKFELVINLKTAKALGLTVPPSLLARADEVIE
jgi:putative ABC transport system substrate-binding protein